MKQQLILWIGTVFYALVMQTTQATTDCNIVTEIPVAECQELLNLYNSTGGASWTNSTGWNNTNTPCNWYGLTCGAGHVIGVKLDNSGLTSSIPDLDLPVLQNLILSHNQLSGTIPNFSKLPLLKNLWLNNNNIDGNIPDFSGLPLLQGLIIMKNRLNGNIPNFSYLPRLQYLHLGHNQLSGTIPNFSNLPLLDTLWLNDNTISGNIPDFSNLPLLQVLYLRGNQLTGSIPNFSNLPKLTTIQFEYNQLSGSIPDFSGLPLLKELYLPSNQLTGSIPNFPNLPELVLIQFDSNQLSGNIPNFSHLPKLEHLHLGYNQLTGTIPNFSGLPALQNLWLNDNKISGNIPDFSGLPNLRGFLLEANQLSGIIPNFTAFNLSTLSFASFHHNCGLTAFNAAQKAVLNSKDSSWETRNTTCPLFSVTLNKTGYGEVSGDGNYATGTTVNLTATPSTGYNFSGWAPATFCADSFVMPNNAVTCTANFVQQTFVLSLTKTGNGRVIGNGSYAMEATVNLTATPDAGYRFSGWSPSPCANSFVMPNSDLICTATFEELPSDTFNIVLNQSGNGQVSGSGNYVAGATVNLTATPDADYKFSGWNPSPCANSFMMPNSNLICTATFEKLPSNTFNIVLNQLGNGQISGSGDYVAGATVNLTATPDADYKFSGWNPSPCANSFIMPNNNLVCTATFEKLSLNTFNIVLNQSGNGQISGSGDYVAGTTVNLTATPDADYKFSGWNPVPCANSFIMPNNNLICTATFEKLPPNTFNIVLNQLGNGQISGSGDYVAGTTVNLTATPDADYKFSGWNPVPCANSFIMPNNNLICTATFEKLPPNTFNIVLNQLGNGQVSGSGDYVAGATVNLTAIPDTGYKFSGWNPVPCANSFVMPNNALTCTATFDQQTLPEQQIFAVSLGEDGNGQVSGGGSYAAGSVVSLTAIPDAGYKFTIWNPSPCASAFIMPNRNLTCTASFVPQIFALTLTKIGNGQITGEGNYATGTTVNLTATPDTNYKFSGWNPSPCADSFIMPSSTFTCTATFESQITITDCNLVTEISITECQSLLELYNSTDGTNWKNKIEWNQTNKPCHWFGVTCKAEHVVEINLSGNHLRGSLPNLNLPNLTWLILSDNQLRGNMPNFSHLPNLTQLFLNNNQLSGSVPNFVSLSNLKWLFLNRNQFSGNLPDFNNLTNLQELVLSENQLNSIVPNFSHLRNLQDLYLFGNQLNGTIPDFSNLPNLRRLSLGDNQLSGNIPDFSGFINLQGLSLGKNQLSGTIPDFSHLPNLQSLYLFENQLSGTIPNFSNLPKLRQLALFYNQLSGTIPNFSTFRFSDLSHVWLNNNCGLIPYDEAQEAVLNNKDSFWKTRNPNCDMVQTSQCVTYDTSAHRQVHIPCIKINDKVYQVDMNLVADSPVLRFAMNLNTLQSIDSMFTEQCAIFPVSNTVNRLRINCLDMGEKYWVEMELVDHSDTTQFDVVDFGKKSNDY